MTPFPIDLIMRADRCTSRSEAKRLLLLHSVYQSAKADRKKRSEISNA